MKKIRLFMVAASAIAVLTAFATKEKPEVALGYRLVSPGNCVAETQVPCSPSPTQNCTIAGIQYRRNSACQFLAFD